MYKKRLAITYALFFVLACGVVAVLRVARADEPAAGAAGAERGTTENASAPRRVKVLFLGDNGHHVPIERCRDIYIVLGERGIDVTYADTLDVLNPATLNRYDVLLLYANWTTISPSQEKALLDYVESGHGFAPIHCGSFCFINAPKITALIGGRFKSHNTGVFKETIAEPEHPIEKGLKPIESWDETYVHDMHNPENRQVLSYRVEGDHREPYTWTRTQGKGRVFYTAWGHDQRTFTNPDFANLLERGIRWAAGDWALQPQPKLMLTYTPAKVPFYPPGKAWGVTSKPITEMQEPLSPQESMKHMVVPPGFEVKLLTSEPQVKKPICMAFDERGRLWVAETFDYPNNMQPAGGGHDQITICQSGEGDGVADKFTVFADKLSIPTSMVFANGGVIVTQAPDILFLKDSTGGDHADVRKVLFRGFGTNDTHATCSNLRWGLDNWIYATVGYSGFDGEVAGQHVRFGEGLFRFKPDGSKLEFLGSTTNNTWGLGISEDNQVFGSTANGNPNFYLHIPNYYYEQVSGWPATRLETISDTPRFFPITDRIRQVDNHGAYTAGAGHALYTARSFPQSYWNRVAFVAEPTGHLLGQFILEPKGSDFVARNDFSFLASDDEWCAPIAAEVGPDGAVWMIDWYNYIIQHNPIPKGWEAGKGGAYETPLRDKRHGRVYRLIWKDGTPSKTFDLHNAATEKLLEALKSDNMLWRLHAQRLLVEQGDKDAIPALIKLAGDNSVDQIGLNPVAIAALWTMQGLGGLDGNNAEATAVAIADLKHPSAGVRQAALDVLPRNASSVAAILDAKSLDDANPQVRKSALLALSQMPHSEDAGMAVYAAMTRKDNADDRWLTDAAAIAASTHDAGFLKAAFAAHPGKSDATVARGPEVNLVPNPSFEQLDGRLPLAWRVRDYSGAAMHAVVPNGHNSAHCLELASRDGADASMYVNVPVEPRTDYRLSAWIKTENLQVDGGRGALLNIHEFQSPPVTTPPVRGTTDWKLVQVSFNSLDRSVIGINCLIGGWGHAKGVAYFDDVKLVRAQGGGLAGTEGRVIGVVANQYAHRAPANSVISTLQAAMQADPSLATVVVDGLAGGWPQGQPPKFAAGDVEKLKQIMKALPADARDGLLGLAGRWGQQEIFADESKAVIETLRTSVANAALAPENRVNAARRLITIDDTPATADWLLKQITPNQRPAIQTGLLDALSSSRDASVGEALVAKYGQLTPAAQREALNILIGQSKWVPALLSGVEGGKIDNRDLLQQQWNTLRNNPDEKLSRLASSLQKKFGHAPTADRKAIVDKFLPVASKGGDASKGKLVFEQNCMVCHTFEGRGGKVGPELTGIGARTKPDLLHKILDPNSSVEGTYQQWIVRTKAGEVIAGRIYAENNASLELIDSAAKLHEIPRTEIDKMIHTGKTLMPEGFEQLGEDKLADLLGYLETSKVKR